MSAMQKIHILFVQEFTTERTNPTPFLASHEEKQKLTTINTFHIDLEPDNNEIGPLVHCICTNYHAPLHYTNTTLIPFYSPAHSYQLSPYSTFTTY